MSSQRQKPLLGLGSVDRAAPSRSNPTYRDDRDIVWDMATGDASALADLYGRHAPHMLALALKIVPRGAAEDIVPPSRSRSAKPCSWDTSRA